MHKTLLKWSREWCNRNLFAFLFVIIILRVTSLFHNWLDSVRDTAVNLAQTDSTYLLRSSTKCLTELQYLSAHISPYKFVFVTWLCALHATYIRQCCCGQNPLFKSYNRPVSHSSTCCFHSECWKSPRRQVK